MRLWHEKLLTVLPGRQLLGQHRECCALRGLGWGKKHATVNYVFRYSPYRLFVYHCKVMVEMARRGYEPDAAWRDACYRGKRCAPWDEPPVEEESYPEHNDAYLRECKDNLAQKGIFL